MEIQTLKIVCFSPTGTTKKIVQSVAKGVNAKQVLLYDITKPDARESIIKTEANDMLIVSVPVYMGRVPALIDDFLRTINAHKTPTACVVVYGNRTYGNALLELHDILSGAGCDVIAGGAFIGEHSFSSKELPIAESRPNTDDLACAEDFGRHIKEKLRSFDTTQEIRDIALPGNYPYGGITQLWNVDFISINDRCVGKGICAEVCPVGAIDKNDISKIDIEKCIMCCACIKNCPVNARIIKESKVKEAAVQLNALFQEPKRPEVFFLTKGLHPTYKLTTF